MEGLFVVYSIRNAEQKRYIGISSDFSARLRQHNDGLSTFTKHRGPWFHEWHSREYSHIDALKLEKLLKRQKGGAGLENLMQLHKGS